MSRPAAVIAAAVAAAAALVAVAAALPSLLGGSSGEEGAYRGSMPPAGIRLPAFSLRRHDGALVRSAELRGRVAVVTFLDSQCTESCPVIAWSVARALEALRPAERRQVAAVAISTDPAEDTRASVRAFLRRNRALGTLDYLGGGEPVARLRPLWRRFEILSSLESGRDTLHSAPVRIYDRRGVWVATLHAGVDLTAANLKHDLRVALRR
ncbi:MAG TPA: SCO family protein [Gaiellaceae bacterium]|nr:SCO family protein [Gaiellaceae bacterium]